MQVIVKKLAEHLGISEHTSQAAGPSGEQASAVLLSVVEEAMKAWLQVKGTRVGFKISVSGAREGRGEGRVAALHPACLYAGTFVCVCVSGCCCVGTIDGWWQSPAFQIKACACTGC